MRLLRVNVRSEGLMQYLFGLNKRLIGLKSRSERADFKAGFPSLWDHCSEILFGAAAP